MSLVKCLEEYPDLPEFVKHNVLYDVATGLAYLHGQDPPILHRDLTANNVLISENFRGKIADLGMAKIINIDASQLSGYKLTEVPGQAHYMPPEAFMKNPIYTQKLDMFSYGILILHTVNHDWPAPSGAMLTESGNKQIPEVERREGHLKKMGTEHPLRELTLQCLENDPEKRPNAIHAAQVLEKVVTENPSPVANFFDMMRQYIKTSKSNVTLIEKISNTEKDKDKLQQSYDEMASRLEAREEHVRSLEQELQATKELLDAPEQSLADKGEGSIRRKILTARQGRMRALSLEIAAIEKCRAQQVYSY